MNSHRGTEFRIWATQVLKDHILKGYSINEKRLREENTRLKELKETVDILERIIEEKQLAAPEAEGLFKVMAIYKGSECSGSIPGGGDLPHRESIYTDSETGGHNDHIVG